jgi:hypothetical protein
MFLFGKIVEYFLLRKIGTRVQKKKKKKKTTTTTAGFGRIRESTANLTKNSLDLFSFVNEGITGVQKLVQRSMSQTERRREKQYLRKALGQTIGNYGFFVSKLGTAGVNPIINI